MSKDNAAAPSTDPYTNDYVPFSFSADFDGAEPVVEEEMRYLAKRKARLGVAHRSTGLALSGGGIRSATFNLGVLQCLARRGLLDQVDYLSTVSGGGYIGASLIWFLHRGGSARADPPFDTSADRFPFGTRQRGERKEDGPATDAQPTEPGGNRNKASALRHLRQNGEFLAPGCGLTIFSLVSVLLRGTFLSLMVFLPLLILAFVLLDVLYLLQPIGAYPQVLSWFFEWHIGSNGTWTLVLNAPLVLAVMLTAMGCVSSILYSLWTYSDSGLTGRYGPRRRFEIYAGRLMVVILALMALGSLPYVQHLLAGGAGQAGFISTVLGIVAAVTSFIKSGTNQGQVKRYLPLLVWPAATLLFYGILLSSYLLAQEVTTDESLLGWGALSLFVVLALFMGRYTNLNYVSIHRYYRDRLMETYLPNVHDALKGASDCQTIPAAADRAALSAMCGPAAGNGPYHIINTNLVLVSSEIKKYRGRGGDNFILTPAYCGSNATGWLRTELFMNNRLTLATAMAISGAAANPHTGIGGSGPTRNPVLSLLMSLLNFRLGYWAPNPNPTINQAQLQTDHTRSGSRLGRLMSDINPLRGYRPNYFVPTLTATAFGSMIGQFIHRVSLKLPGALSISDRHFGKNEKNRFIELTDGGHFENLGLYELVRRRLPRIIVCDAAADPDFGFNDLANAIEKVRVDFGAVVTIDIAPLIPHRSSKAEEIAAAETACITGRIVYADHTEAELYYIKTTFFQDLPADLFAYKKSNPAFPDETTADQFFDEKQFEAYRELGYTSAGLLQLPESASSPTEPQDGSNT